MQWPFVKYVGCGNDFILFDNREEKFPHENKRLIQQFCHRQWGIGADGVILRESSSKADFRMRIFNADGSEAEMCGNGIRCLVHWHHQLDAKKNSYTVETRNRVHHATVDQSSVCIDMGSPTDLEWEVTIPYQDELITLHSMSTGVPHAILFHPDIDKIDLKTFGSYVRHHPRWQPRGTNLTLVQPLQRSCYKIRTFERGVEGETLACGTGATAAAIAAAYQLDAGDRITVYTLAGELKIGFSQKTAHFADVTMTGPAQQTFEGTINI